MRKKAPAVAVLLCQGGLKGGRVGTQCLLFTIAIAVQWPQELRPLSDVMEGRPLQLYSCHFNVTLFHIVRSTFRGIHVIFIAK